MIACAAGRCKNAPGPYGIGRIRREYRIRVFAHRNLLILNDATTLAFPWPFPRSLTGRLSPISAAHEGPLLFRVVGCLPFVENAIGPLADAGRRRTSIKGGNRGMCVAARCSTGLWGFD